jgi:Leucine-rich repeat (LRR) protein
VLCVCSTITQQNLDFRQNLIRKIEGLENCKELVELSFRDNELAAIEGLETITKLR